MSKEDDLKNGELPVDAELGVANADDDDVVEKGEDAPRDEMDDVEEVLPQGGTEPTPGSLP